MLSFLIQWINQLSLQIAIFFHFIFNLTVHMMCFKKFVLSFMFSLSWVSSQYLLISLKSSYLFVKSSKYFLLEYWGTLYKWSKLKKPSSLYNKAEIIALTHVFPLLGYEAIQIIIISIYKDLKKFIIISLWLFMLYQLDQVNRV